VQWLGPLGSDVSTPRRAAGMVTSYNYVSAEKATQGSVARTSGLLKLPSFSWLATSAAQVSVVEQQEGRQLLQHLLAARSPGWLYRPVRACPCLPAPPGPLPTLASPQHLRLPFAPRLAGGEDP